MRTIFFALLLVGCDVDIGRKEKSEPVDMTIVQVYQEPSRWGCLTTDWNTIIRAQDGRTDKMCGKWGEPGEKISGCWISGNRDLLLNGFRRTC